MLGCTALAVCYDLHECLTRVCTQDTYENETTNVEAAKSIHDRLSLSMHASNYEVTIVSVAAKQEVHAQDSYAYGGSKADHGGCRIALSSKTYLNIRHDKRHNLILHTLSHQAQTGASCHGDVPYTLVPVLTRFLFGELLQQHAHERLQGLSDEVVICSVLPNFLSLFNLEYETSGFLTANH